MKWYGKYGRKVSGIVKKILKIRKKSRLNSEMIGTIWKKSWIVKRYGRKASRIVIRYGKYGRNASWIVKRYEKYLKKTQVE